MRHPLLPAAALAALVILVCEGFFGLFSKLSDPMRSPSHYAHFIESGECWMRVQISDIPEERKKTIRATVDVLEIADTNGQAQTCKGKMLLYVEKPSSISAGDILLVRTSPRLPSGADNPHQFDYRRHLQRRGILHTAYVTSADYRITEHSNKGVKARISSYRQRLIEVIHYSSLTDSQQGIAESILLGWDSELDDDTRTRFRTAGITHLLCVSGLHVGIIAVLVGWLLSFLGNRRHLRIIKGIIKIVSIWAFVVITGMAPSAMRAGLMFSLIAVGQIFSNRPPTLNAIAASALILLIAKPLMLFEVGFQLSYAAVIAIVVLVPPCEELIPIPEGKSKMTKLMFNILRKIRTLFCVSLVAQIATTPLTLYYFHSFPPYFLVANMTVTPFAALLLGSVLAMLAVAWWPMAFKVAGSVASTLLSATEHITRTISLWPNALIENIYFDETLLILSVIILFMLGWLIVRPQWGKALAAAALLVAAIIYILHINTRSSRQLCYDIYRVGNRTAIEFFIGKESILLCDSATASNPESIDYQTANNLIWHKAKRLHIMSLDTTYEDAHLIVKDRFIGFAGKTFRVVDRSNYRQRSTYIPKVDYLLLRQSPYITIAELQQQYRFDTLIILSQNTERRSSEWQSECQSLKVNYKL